MESMPDAWFNSLGSARAWRPSRLECLGGVIVSPVRTFEYLADRPQRFLPVVVVALYLIVSSVIPMVSLIVAGAPAALGPGGVGSSGANGTIYSLITFSMMTAYGAVAMAALFFAKAGVLSVIAKHIGGEPRIHSFIPALAFAEFVPRLVEASIQQIYTLALRGGAGFAKALPTGIAPIFVKCDPSALAYAILRQIELFNLWSYALVAIAVCFTARVSKERAMSITLVYAVVGILLVAGLAIIGEMSGEY